MAEKSPEIRDLQAKQIYNLCMLTQGRLTSETLKQFLKDSYDVLSKI